MMRPVNFKEVKMKVLFVTVLLGLFVSSNLYARRIPECGIERYETRRDPICGNLYKEKRTRHCGVESYNWRWSWKCPGGRQEKRRTWSNCNGTAYCGEAGYELIRRERGHICYARPRSGDHYSSDAICIRPEITKYCSHPDFGVKNYNLCRSRSHGFEQYKECEDPSFGAIYNDCEVTKDKAELTEYIETMENLAESLVLAYAAGTSNYLALIKAEKALGCTILKYEENDQASVANTLADKYFIVFSRPYEASQFNRDYCMDYEPSIPSLDEAGCENISSVECNTLQSIESSRESIIRETSLIMTLLQEPVSAAYENLSERLETLNDYLTKGIN